MMKKILSVLLILFACIGYGTPASANVPIKVFTVNSANYANSMCSHLKGQNGKYEIIIPPGIVYTSFNNLDPSAANAVAEEILAATVLSSDVIVTDVNLLGGNRVSVNHLMALAAEHNKPMVLCMNPMFAAAAAGAASNATASNNNITVTGDKGHPVLTGLSFGDYYTGGSGNIGFLDLSTTSGMTALMSAGGEQAIVAYSPGGASFNRVFTENAPSTGTKSYTFSAPVVVIGCRAGNAEGAAPNNENLLKLIDNAIAWVLSSADSGVKVKVTCPAGSLTLIVAAYAKGKLIDVNTQAVTESGEVTVDIDISGADNVRAMLWDSLQNMCPVGAAEIIQR